MTQSDPSTFTEFVDDWETEDRLLPVTLHDGTTGNLSLDHYSLILVIQADGEVHIAMASGVDPKDGGAALASIGLDLQNRD